MRKVKRKIAMFAGLLCVFTMAAQADDTYKYLRCSVSTSATCEGLGGNVCLTGDKLQKGRIVTHLAGWCKDKGGSGPGRDWQIEADGSHSLSCASKDAYTVSCGYKKN